MKNGLGIGLYRGGQCLLCHEAPCTKSCGTLDPAAVIRSVRFRNEQGAALRMPEQDLCSRCAAPCESVCPAGVPIRELMTAVHGGKQAVEEAPGAEEIDLSCELCGIRLENPFMLSSSVVASSYEMCVRAFEMGWAGVSLKTICMMDMHEISPRFSALKGADGSFYGFKNVEQLSPNTLEADLDTIRRLKKNYPSKVILASVMGRSEEEWTQLAAAVSEAGADAIECNFSCPNMEEKGIGVDIGQNPEAVRRFTAAVRQGTHLPILAKLTPNVTDVLPAARAAIEAGANGIAAINTVKSITNINLDTLASAPSVRGLSSVGGYSGAAVKPIALRFISDLAGDKQLKGCHISGMGGIETWADGLEFLLLGAGSLQVTTAVMQYGCRIIDDLLDGLRIYMAQRGYRRIAEIVGQGAGNVVDANQLERDTIVYPKFIRERCVGCGRCYVSCRDGGHQAISFQKDTRKPILVAKRCVGCHLCVLVCPRDAISGSGRRVTPKA